MLAAIAGLENRDQAWYCPTEVSVDLKKIFEAWKKLSFAPLDSREHSSLRAKPCKGKCGDCHDALMEINRRK
jgi:hypothetical protein